MYLNRLYFRKDTGALIYRNYQVGWPSIPTVDEDFKSLSPLQGYVKDAVEVIEIAESDIETQKKIDTCTSYRMDTPTKEIVFSFTQAEASLDQVKTTQKDLISQACANVVTGGFKSSAYKNTEKIYGSTLEDQSNITGNALSAVSKVAGVPECQEDKFYYHAQGEDFTEWQASECLTLARDFKIFKEQQLIRSKQLQFYIDTLKTAEEVQKVTWDTQIPT